MNSERTVTDSLARWFLPVGFRKSRGSVFTASLKPGWYGWVNVAQFSNQRGRVAKPSIGVIHIPLERVVSDLTGVAFRPKAGVSFAVALSSITRSSHSGEWLFPRGLHESYEATAHSLFSTVSEYGVPFMHEIASLQALARSYEARGFTELDVAFRRPVILSMLGRNARARDVYAQSLERLRRCSQSQAALYEAFGERFSAWINGDRPVAVSPQ
jgi:hypothetical protein